MIVPAPPTWASQLLSVGVTGTNGKTTTTSWIAAMLGAISSPVARATTVGFFIDDEEVVIAKDYGGFLSGMRRAQEAGGTHTAVELTSQALMQGFSHAWPCKVGVFTNLTHDHLDAHGSAEHYLASKAQLFVSLREGGTAVLNAADETFSLLRAVLRPDITVRSYAVPSRGAVEGTPDLVATSVQVDWAGTTITCANVKVHVKAIGEVYAENALAALLGAEAAGVDRARALDRLSAAPAPPGRFEVIHREPYVVVDYAHSPDALARTVKTARALATKKLWVVFGAGGHRDRAKRRPMGEAAKDADTVILTSDNPRDEDPASIAAAIAEGLKTHRDVRSELDRRTAIEQAINEASKEDVILIAGKGHETNQELSNAIRHFSDTEAALAALRAR